MRFLIDTNIIIPLEPTRVEDVQREDPRMTELARRVHEAGHVIYVHRACSHDFARNGNADRRALHQALVRRYPTLEVPKKTPPSFTEAVGDAPIGSNDWVDNQHLLAVYSNAVEYLITNDEGLRRKAIKARLAERVVTSSEALEMVRRLFDQAPTPPPAVISMRAHELNPEDPIFESFRCDYPGFDEWLAKARREHRQSWIIEAPSSDSYAAVAIVNAETADQRFAATKTLKICSFKVAYEASGLAYGELLLRAVFDFAYANRFRDLYITVLPKYDMLQIFLETFGFSSLGTKTSLGESEFTKPMVTVRADEEALPPFAYHVRYGPYAWSWGRSRLWIVPIQPRYHELLFPATAAQPSLFPGDRPSGNSIRKAYLSQSPRWGLSRGDILLFYRSDDLRALTVLGIVEDARTSSEPDTIAAFVGKRTVYRYENISDMCSGGRVLAVLFREAHGIHPPVQYDELVEHQLVNAPPQSIQQIRSGDTEWLRNRLTRQ